MKVKTSELKDKALDWLVAVCELPNPAYCYDNRLVYVTCELDYGMGTYSPSTDWSQGGPIIEREGINTLVHVTVNGVITEWKAGKDWPISRFPYYTGPTPLISAMRYYVASKWGDEVEIPEELT